MLEYVRWVMVRKRDDKAPTPPEHVPRLPDIVTPSTLGDACPPIDVAGYDFELAGSPSRLATTPSGRRSTTLTASPSRRPSI